MAKRALLLLGILASISGFSAQGQEKAEEVRLSVYTEYPSPSDVLSNRPGAFAFMSFFEALMKEADISYDIFTMPGRRASMLAQTGRNSLVFPLARTPKREASYHWVGKVVRQPIHYYLIKLKERADLSVSNIQDATNYRIGLVGQDNTHEYFQDLGFENLQPVNSYEQNIEKLVLGRIDFLVQTGAEIYPLCERTGISCDLLEPAMELTDISSGIYYAMGNDTDPDLVTRLDQAYETLVADGSYDALFGELFESVRETMPMNQ